MKKTQLVEALVRYANLKMGRTLVQNTMAQFLAYYFSQLETPANERYGSWNIEPYIPQLLLGACEDFRTSEDPFTQELRAQYESELERSFPDLTDMWGSGVEQALTVQSLGYLFKDALGAEWIATKIDVVFNAEQHLLQQQFYKFLDQVFRKGMFQIRDETQLRGMSGTFGETTIRTYDMAGRLMITFARPDEQREHTVSFVCEDDDPLGLGGGAQSVYTDLRTALDMISDVIAGWPKDKAAQLDAFVADTRIGIG